LILKKIFINNINESLRLVQQVGCSKIVWETLAKKGVNNTIVINNMNNRGLNILKQEAISVGADVAVNKNVSKFKQGISNAVLFANHSQLTKLIPKLLLQPFGLQDFVFKLKKVLNDKIIFRCKNKNFNLKHPIVMGVINTNTISPQKALKRAIIFEKLGISILCYKFISVDSINEIKNLYTILKTIKKHIKIPIAINTYKYKTVQFALNEGVDIVIMNDIFALSKQHNKLARLISSQKAGIILSPIKKNVKINTLDYTSKVYNFLTKIKQYTMNVGIEEQYIAVDLGLDFKMNIKHNIELIKNINIFSSLGAIVGAVSNKNILQPFFKTYKTAYIVTNLLILLYGCNIISVSDVQTTANIIKFLKIFKKI
jgi:dihydropteroate synthase